MSEREHIVSVNRGVDLVAFNQEMIATTGAGSIPSRTVGVADPRATNIRSTHYMLTDAEAETLKADPRVFGVDLLPELDPNTGIGFDTVQSGNFTKTTLDRGDFLNWGMRRVNEEVNIYTGVNPTAGGYGYTLDGTGVDVVIVDSGIQADHPEFQDADGVSRVQQINWFTASGVSGTMPTAHYTDYHGHGTHVAGTAVGKTYGWAKNARIFSVKVGGLEGTGDSNTGISVSNCFDIIKNWHNAKEADPLTGVKRPTIVNMSWGYSSNVGNSISNITSIVYRGTTYNSGSDGSFGNAAHMWSTYGFATYYSSGAYRFPIRVASVDTDVDELIAAGVHVCIAAGNNSFKADVSGGDDYNNIVFASNGVTANYHRGSSPYSDDAFMVGCADATPTNATTERKVSFSTTGPGVNIYAAGHNIISCTSQTNRFGDAVYYGSSSWRQCNISGTSMASPQVAGVGATYLQTEPGLTPAQLKSKIETDSLAILNTASDLTNYEDTDDLVGGPNRFMLSRYGKTQTFSSNIKGLVVK